MSLDGKEAEMLRENTHMDRENEQTPHRKVGFALGPSHYKAKRLFSIPLCSPVLTLY